MVRTLVWLDRAAMRNVRSWQPTRGTVEAASHFEAMTMYDEDMGWGEYTTDFPDLDRRTYVELGWTSE